MKFIKKLSLRKNTCTYGYVKINGNTIGICIKANNKVIDEVGIIENGIGVTLKPSSNESKVGYTQTKRYFEENDIPVNLQAEGYKFRINAEKVSDTEFVFKFDKAFMVKR